MPEWTEAIVVRGTSRTRSLRIRRVGRKAAQISSEWLGTQEKEMGETRDIHTHTPSAWLPDTRARSP